MALTPAASTCWASCRKNHAPPPASAASTASAASLWLKGTGSGSVSGAWSARCRLTQPSLLPSAPWPTHSTSPEAVSSSSIAGS